MGRTAELAGVVEQQFDNRDRLFEHGIFLVSTTASKLVDHTTILAITVGHLLAVPLPFAIAVDVAVAVKLISRTVYIS